MPSLKKYLHNVRVELLQDKTKILEKISSDYFDECERQKFEICNAVLSRIEEIISICEKRNRW